MMPHNSHTASVCTDGSRHTIEAQLVVEASCINHLRNYADVACGGGVDGNGDSPAIS